MIPSIDNSPFVNHKDRVGRADCRESMRADNHGTAVDKVGECPLNESLCLAVQM